MPLLTKGFLSQNELNKHFIKHSGDLGVTTPEEYLNLADAFLGGPKEGWQKLCECQTCDVDIKYDTRSQSFGIIDDRYIITFFKLTRATNRLNEQYFKENCDKTDCQGTIS